MLRPPPACEAAADAVVMASPALLPPPPPTNPGPRAAAPAPAVTSRPREACPASTSRRKRCDSRNSARFSSASSRCRWAASRCRPSPSRSSSSSTVRMLRDSVTTREERARARMNRLPGGSSDPCGAGSRLPAGGAVAPAPATLLATDDAALETRRLRGVQEGMQHIASTQPPRGDSEAEHDTEVLPVPLVPAPPSPAAPSPPNPPRSASIAAAGGRFHGAWYDSAAG